MQEGLARETINRIQKLRKKCHLRPQDRIEIFITTSDDTLAAVIDSKEDFFLEVFNCTAPLLAQHCPPSAVIIAEEQVEPIGDTQLTICLTNAAPSPCAARLSELCQGDVQTAQALADYLRCRKLSSLAWHDGMSG